jgi:hypothetical protein
MALVYSFIIIFLKYVSSRNFTLSFPIIESSRDENISCSVLFINIFNTFWINEKLSCTIYRLGLIIILTFLFLPFQT